MSRTERKRKSRKFEGLLVDSVDQGEVIREPEELADPEGLPDEYIGY